MSHEIRTPLGAILGFSELLTSAAVSPSDKINFASAIRRNGELLSNIINDILDFSKVDAGKMEIEAKDVALSEILSDTQALLGLQAAKKGIALNFSTEKTAPSIIHTDPLRLRQVLLNIIGNAIKFTDKGSVDIHIKLVNLASLPKLAFIVKDSGRGIAKEQMLNLFVAFSQADISTKRRFGGTGLGLVLARHFANLLGGDVELTTSDPEKGSTFTITIDPGPINKSQPTSPNQEEKLPATAPLSPLSGIKVLLADDSIDNQVLVNMMLKIAGATVEVADNGKEAIEKANRNHYDVLLMDLQMPVMDGYEATAELRKTGYRGKIVALTAHALSEERERCLQSGFEDRKSVV